MNPMSLLKFGAMCLETLEIDGLTPESTDPSPELEDEARRIGKAYVTPTLSALVNDFTNTSSFWITLRESGELRAVMGMRYDQLGSEPVSSYWKRAYKRQYGAELEGHPQILPDLLSGNMVYMGDLFFHPDIRGSQARLMSFVHLAHIQCFQKWPDANYIYAFHHRRDVLRGKTDQYGFNNRIPNPQIWKGGPNYRSAHEYLAILSREEFNQKVEYYVKYPDVFLGQ